VHGRGRFAFMDETGLTYGVRCLQIGTSWRLHCGRNVKSPEQATRVFTPCGLPRRAMRRSELLMPATMD